MATRIAHLLILQVLEMVVRYSIAAVVAEVDFLEMVTQAPLVVATPHVALAEPHLRMAALVEQEVTQVDSEAAHLAIGITTQAVAEVAATQVAREVTTTAVAAVEALITMDLHKQILQVQTTRLDL